MARVSLAMAVSLALFVSTLGCSALNGFGPPSLVGTPDSTGLVVVQGDVKVISLLLGLRTSATLTGGQIVRVDKVAGVAEGGSVSDLVIFSGLTPGRWQLVMMEADWQSGNTTMHKTLGVPIESAQAFSFDVHAGEPVYVGVAHIEEDFRSGKQVIRYSLQPDPAAKAKTWAKLVELYDKTAWGPALRAKL